MKVVADASVVIKWLINDPGAEPDSELAARLMKSVAGGEIEIVQPIHWLVEVAAVLARLSPTSAADDVTMLQAMQLPVRDDPAVLRRASDLAISLKQNVFDTLYHAVALQVDGAVLVTADEKYWRTAKSRGRIVTLRQWRLPQ